MAPKPFSQIKDTTLFFSTHLDDGSDGKVYIAAANLIHAGAYIDAIRGNMLAFMLGADSKAALAMYSAINSAPAKAAALKAAAKQTLDGEAYDLFEAVANIADAALKARHRAAHCIWGRCRLPDTIVFIQPEALRSYMGVVTAVGVMADRAGAQKIDPPFKLPDLGKGALVYDLDDLKMALDRLMLARAILDQFFGALMSSNPESRADRLAKLSGEPNVAEALARIKAKQRVSEPDV